MQTVAFSPIRPSSMGYAGPRITPGKRALRQVHLAGELVSDSQEVLQASAFQPGLLGTRAAIVEAPPGSWELDPCPRQTPEAHRGSGIPQAAILPLPLVFLQIN